jgi:hypothetical protein
LRPVKTDYSSSFDPIGDRLAVLLDLFSPWERISLTYRQFAAELGPPITEAAVKKWPHRKSFPPEAARLIVTKARDRGLIGVTLEWLLWGEGGTPHKAASGTPNRSPERRSQPPEAAREERRRPTAEPEPHGRSAARIAQALEADLSHNEFGQWSSVEVQHTVIWALKDLARRLWVLRFDMGKTFELTDEWAAEVGLPVRPPERSPDEVDRERA